MKIETTGVGFESNFKAKSIDYRIGDPQMIIYLLRNKLYSDKLRVFIQEYISNARDANREVGTSEHELDITYPSKTDPVFKVRDYGPGLSPERVEDVFTVFGASTKRATDEFIGGFGIGAKSAWAYTDSFVVTSYHDGTERQYLCHIGNTQKGSMDLLHEGPTTQANGVEVQVQVKEQDITRAYSLIRQLTILWPQKPRYFNDLVPTVQEGEGFDDPIPFMPFRVYHRFATESYAAFGGHYISVDGIPYPLNDSYIETLLQSFSVAEKPFEQDGVRMRRSNRGSIFVFDAKTGEVDIAASREQIEINEKFEAFKDKIRRQILEGFERNYRHHAALGGQMFLKFLNESYMSRLRFNLENTKRKENTEYAKIEQNTIQNFTQEALAACRKSLKKNKNAEAFISNIPALNGIHHHCFYFPEIKSFVVDAKIYPFDLFDIEYYIRSREITGLYRSRRKETFCATDRMSNRTGQGANPAHYVYNASELKPERIKQLTKRVPRDIHGILKVKDVPQRMKDMGCKSLEEVLIKPQPSYRSYSPRRTAGSVRSIDLRGDGGLSFGSFQDAASISEQTDDFVYAWTSEKTEWKQKLHPLFTRMHMNDFQFVQLNKKALATLQEQFPERKYVHWIEWEKQWRVGSRHFTPLEWNIFGLEWFAHSFKDIYDHYFKHSYTTKAADAVIHAVPEYKQIHQISLEIHRKAPKRDLFISKYGLDIKNLKKSEVYNLRVQMLKKYPGLHFVEMTYTETNSGRMDKEDFLKYFKNPNRFLKSFGKELTGMNGWNKAGRLNCY